MSVILRTTLCIAFLTSAVGCQVCHPAFKNACAQDACGPEIHVRAPAQKVVVHRDDCPPPEAPCVEEKPALVETKAAPAPQPTTAAPSPSPQQTMMVGQPTQQQVMAQAGYAAIPSLPTSTALTITCDIIRIPIPIPRLRTVEIPPETKLSYVQIGGGGAIGAVAAPMPVAQQAAFVQPAPVQAVGAGVNECIRPEHLAAAAAIVRAQNASAQSAPPNGASPAAAADPRLKVIEELERRCSELEQAKAAKSAGQAAAPQPNGPPPAGEWKSGGK